MSLSDACFDFCEAIQAANSLTDKFLVATELYAAIIHYANDPWYYGPEIDQIEQACITYLVTLDGAALARLQFTAEAIREFLDTPPGITRAYAG